MSRRNNKRDDHCYKSGFILINLKWYHRVNINTSQLWCHSRRGIPRQRLPRHRLPRHRLPRRHLPRRIYLSAKVGEGAAALWVDLYGPVPPFPFYENYKNVFFCLSAAHVQTVNIFLQSSLPFLRLEQVYFLMPLISNFKSMLLASFNEQNT